MKAWSVGVVVASLREFLCKPWRLVSMVDARSGGLNGLLPLLMLVFWISWSCSIRWKEKIWYHQNQWQRRKHYDLASQFELMLNMEGLSSCLRWNLWIVPSALQYLLATMTLSWAIRANEFLVKCGQDLDKEVQVCQWTFNDNTSRSLWVSQKKLIYQHNAFIENLKNENSCDVLGVTNIKPQNKNIEFRRIKEDAHCKSCYLQLSFHTQSNNNNCNTDRNCSKNNSNNNIDNNNGNIMYTDNYIFIILSPITKQLAKFVT